MIENPFPNEVSRLSISQRVKCETERNSDVNTWVIAGKGPATSFKCRLCNTHFSSMTNLNRHLRNRCRVLPSFLCAMCTHRAASQDNLKRHIRKWHMKPDLNDLA